jgi:hypothetical protein
LINPGRENRARSRTSVSCCAATAAFLMAMRIYFEATVDELIEVHERLAARSRVARSWRLEGATMTALLAGLLAGIPIYILASTNKPLPVALMIAGVAAVVGAGVAWLAHDGQVKRRLRTYFREQYGDRSVIPVELELGEAGIWIRQLGVQNVFEWSSVEEIVQSEDAIEFYIYGGRAVFVRRRAFASAEEQRQFIETARLHLNASRGSSNWLRDG